MTVKRPDERTRQKRSLDRSVVCGWKDLLLGDSDGPASSSRWTASQLTPPHLHTFGQGFGPNGPMGKKQSEQGYVNHNSSRGGVEG